MPKSMRPPRSPAKARANCPPDDLRRRRSVGPVTLSPRSPKAVEEALDMSTDIVAKVFESKSPATRPLILKLQGGDVSIFGEGTEKFPAGTQVFDNQLGVKGVVVGAERSGRLVKTTRLLVKTKKAEGFTHSASPNELSKL